MESINDLRIPVEPTRIGEIGVGSFLILAGGILYLLSCVVGTSFLKNPARFQLHLLSTVIYGTLILFLANAKRRSRWTIPDEVVSDVDNLWLIHILVGTTIAIGCILGLLAVFHLDYSVPVVAKEIESEKDRRWNGHGRAKFLF